MRSVSILLPSFNGGKYIAEQIRSIVDQSFGDFELLVQDDGSSDETVDILRTFEKLDRRITLNVSDENQGQNRRLLSLLTQARGSLIAFADQDDVWDKNKLKLLHARLARSESLAFGSSHLIDLNGNPLGQTLHQAARLEIKPDALRLIFFPIVSAHAMLVKKEVIRGAVFGSSALFDCLISLDAQFAGGMAFEELAITYHRIHGSNQNNADVSKAFADVRFASKIKFPRFVLSSGHDDRLIFYRRVRHLANSSVIPRNLQLTFQRAADLCQAAWFSALPRRIRAQHRSYELLSSMLLPLASSQMDMDQARVRLSALCSSYRRRRFADIVR